MIKNYFKISMEKFCKGETLLEVIIALFVVVIGSATATNLIVTSLKANAFNRDSLVALNLAQEGVEMVRNIRDSNWIAHSSDPEKCWNIKPGSTDCTSSKLSGTYSSDWTTGNDFILNDGIDNQEKNFLVNGSKFYRSITISYRLIDDNGVIGADSDADNGTVMLVTSRVGWMDGGMEREIKLNTALTRYK